MRRRDFYVTTHNTHNGKTFMPPVGFEPTISAGERPQTYALDRAATETFTFWRLKPAIMCCRCAFSPTVFFVRIHLSSCRLCIRLVADGGNPFTDLEFQKPYFDFEMCHPRCLWQLICRVITVNNTTICI